MLAKVAALTASAALVVMLAGCGDPSEVARVGVDWTGNDISIEAVPDPKVAGVTCHVSFFQRSAIDRLQQGNWFEDPSNSALACVATGPMTIGDIALDGDGEEVFREGRSLIWKSLRVNRMYDAANNSLIYLAYARQVQLGSAKMSLSVVPLGGQEVTWERGAPPAAASTAAIAASP